MTIKTLPICDTCSSFAFITKSYYIASYVGSKPWVDEILVCSYCEPEKVKTYDQILKEHK